MALETREVLAARDRDLEGARVAVQGYGNVGRFAAWFLSEMGAKIVALSDVRGGVLRPDGLDLGSVDQHFADTGSVVEAPGTWALDGGQVLEVECDVLIPTAIGGVISGDNVEAIQAPFIVEGANGLITPYADSLLGERGVVTISDILANAGGVLVSYFEWSQNVQQYSRTEDHVYREMERHMVASVSEVERRAADGISLRDAAFVIGVERVAEAIEMRGFV